MSAQASQTYSPFASLAGQHTVVSFFEAAQAQNNFAHAYLFVGPLGSGKTEAATALAQAILCAEGGCGSCDDCARIARGKHPDVHVVEPQGVSGYLAEQVRELIHDVSLAPVRASGKVYVITRGDLLRGAPANAFLKTMEEPPEGVTFVLLARTREGVMETIVSRCQVVVFRTIPEAEALRLVRAKSGAEEAEARVALSVTGSSPARAISFLASPSQRQMRREVIDKLEHLMEADDLAVLNAAKELVVQLKAPLDEVRAQQEREMEQGKEILSKGALSALEKRHKRELTQQERANLNLALTCTRSWLRDCLMVSAASPLPLVNYDCYSTIQRVGAEIDEAAALKALQSVETAQSRLNSNVTPQLVIEALLFDIKEALHA